MTTYVPFLKTTPRPAITSNKTQYEQATEGVNHIVADSPQALYDLLLLNNKNPSNYYAAIAIGEIDNDTTDVHQVVDTYLYEYEQTDTLTHYVAYEFGIYAAHNHPLSPLYGYRPQQAYQYDSFETLKRLMAHTYADLCDYSNTHTITEITAEFQDIADTFMYGIMSEWVNAGLVVTVNECNIENDTQQLAYLALTQQIWASLWVNRNGFNIYQYENDDIQRNQQAYNNCTAQLEEYERNDDLVSDVDYYRCLSNQQMHRILILEERLAKAHQVIQSYQ